MKYKVTHTTQYYYGEPVPLCHNVVHLKPRDTERQTCLSHAIGVSPSPTTMRERFDFFGNPVEWFSVQEPHDTLKIVASSLVQVKSFEPPTGLWWPAWDEVARMLSGRRDPALLDARQFTFDSTFVPIDAELAEYAAPSFAPGRPMLDCVVELTHRIYEEFKFDSGVTTIGTPVLDVLHHRHGVCQDFAHLQIGCLRSLGLAARYVSGYLVTRPPAGRPRLVGADTSHAWVAAYFPDFGWIDFDPTNGLIPTVGHITLGWARDYDDISPVRGVVVGGRHHSLGVSVDVEPITTDDVRPVRSTA
ncbi:MAG: transglutaminase domain protein [Phycisphaerales bacterium]|nr:transglutaminase domain protein [Phycisphaerales bacterium]